MSEHGWWYKKLIAHRCVLPVPDGSFTVGSVWQCNCGQRWSYRANQTVIPTWEKDGFSTWEK